MVVAWDMSLGKEPTRLANVTKSHCERDAIPFLTYSMLHGYPAAAHVHIGSSNTCHPNTSAHIITGLYKCYAYLSIYLASTARQISAIASRGAHAQS
jgi:hypothetical protein